MNGVLNRAELGKKGEDVALKFLTERGMQLVARNWRSGHKELDLVMDDGEFLRVVEVRSLNYPNNADPAETVDWHKSRMVIAAARAFVARNKIAKEVVFDVVSVLFNGEIYKLEYIPAAFAPTW